VGQIRPAIFLAIFIMKDIIIFLGIPGSGKGTQAHMLCDEFGYGHISTGDLLRAIDADPDAPQADKESLANMKAGKLVSDDFIYRIAFEAIQTYLDNDQGVVLDGAIRNVAQAEQYQAFFASVGKESEVLAIEIALDDETATERILSRAETSGGERPDDQPEVIAKRMQEQGNTAIAPIREYYESLEVLKQVDGSKDIDGVKEEIGVVINS
jgi:adenylate kinase